MVGCCGSNCSVLFRWQRCPREGQRVWNCRSETGRLFAQHTNDKIGSLEVVRFELKKIVCCAQRRFGRDLFQRIWLMVVCAIRFRMIDLFVICILDLMSCRRHDSCQGRVFSHFLCSGAKLNTNGTVKFSVLPLRMQARRTHVHNF